MAPLAGVAPLADGQMEKGSRTALIMRCRKYLRGTEHAVGNYPGLVPKYVAAKQALDRASPYRDAYLQ